MAATERLSIGVKRQAKKVGLSVERLAMADLVAVGWEPLDAWVMCVREGLTWDKEALQREVGKLVDKPEFKERVDATRSMLSAAQIEKFVNERESIKKRDIKKKTSKDALLQDLLAARENVRPGTLDYAKMTMQIADLTNAKKEETVKEDTTIHYYLPAKCSLCSLKQEFDERQAKKEENDEYNSKQYTNNGQQSE